MESKILKNEYIFLDENIKTQDQAFEFISQKALDLKLVDDKAALIAGYKKREQEGTTGFEDGFAIPHARIKQVKEAAVIVVRFKNDVDWKSMDGKPTRVAIALLIPDGPSGEEHLAILSDIAIKLMNADFKKTLLTSKTSAPILKALTSQEKAKTTAPSKTNKDGLNILVITSCITGVAHTYMAEEKMLGAGKANGYNLRVETHGSKGVGTPFTKDEIANAELVIFATDTNVDNSRFVGKKFYKTKVADAIKDPNRIIEKAKSEGYILTTQIDVKNQNNSNERTGPLQHVLAGISYMIPVIILGGVCLAFSIGIAKAIWGPSSGTAGPDDDKTWNVLNVLNIIGGAAFTLMIPVLAGFIGNSIAGRSTIAPAMVAAFIGNSAGAYDSDGKTVTSLGDLMPWIKGMDVVQTPLGFIGAIIAGLLVGYTVKWINTWNVPKSLRPAMPIFFVPLVCGILMSLIFIYLIGAPIGWVMEKVQTGIKKAYEGNIGIGVGIGLGLILGAMGGFDMGGPVNKIAFVTCSMLVTNEIYEPMGALAAGIPVAPLSMGLSTIICRKFFNKDEQGLGTAAMIMGCIGISEGAIPFAIRDPKRAIICNVIGSSVASGIAGAFKVEDHAAHGGPIVAILGAVPYGTQTLYFFIAIAIGVAITTSIYCLWMIADFGVVGSTKYVHNEHINRLKLDADGLIDDAHTKIFNLKQDGDKDGIANEKQKIAQIKAELKANIAKAKQALKSINPEEKAYNKENKKSIIEFKSKIKSALIEDIKSAKSQMKAISDRKEKEAASDNLDKIRQESVNKLDNYYTDLNIKFTDKYRQAIK